ncbi:hypothetical protein ScPMuIL_011271 [Solemya velum]
MSMITLLVEVLEKGPSNYQPAMFQILHCMVHYVDFGTSPSNILNTDLFSVVSRHVAKAYFSEVVKVMKLILGMPATNTTTLPDDHPITVDFSNSLPYFEQQRVFVEFRNPPFIVRSSDTLDHIPLEHPSTESVSRVPTPPWHVESPDVCLDLHQLCPKSNQPPARTRERLAELLTCYGQKRLPKSPSVIFSQSSDTLDHQQSVASSGEEASIPDVSTSDILLSDNNGNELINMTIKGFDFLDNELEESEENDFFSQLGDNRRHSFESRLS